MCTCVSVNVVCVHTINDEDKCKRRRRGNATVSEARAIAHASHKWWRRGVGKTKTKKEIDELKAKRRGKTSFIWRNFAFLLFAFPSSFLFGPLFLSRRPLFLFYVQDSSSHSIILTRSLTHSLSLSLLCLPLLQVLVFSLSSVTR